jgi:hypothetical protein
MNSFGAPKIILATAEGCGIAEIHAPLIDRSSFAFEGCGGSIGD